MMNLHLALWRSFAVGVVVSFIVISPVGTVSAQSPEQKTNSDVRTQHTNSPARQHQLKMCEKCNTEYNVCEGRAASAGGGGEAAANKCGETLTMCRSRHGC